nr:MAG: amino acid transporter [Bacteroidota bacterium]
MFKAFLGLWDGTMIVAGSMIGSGIFIVSADMLRNVGSAGWLIAVWVITGFMTVTAAVSYGELSGMYPRAGGQYVYLQEAYGKLVAFLYGWSFFTVIQTATIAAVGVAFSKFTAYLIPAVGEDLVLLDLQFLQVSPAQVLAIATIVLLTYVNTRGVREGKIVQSTFTVTKILSLLGLTLFGFIFMDSHVWSMNWSGEQTLHSLREGTESYTFVAALGAIAAAMVGSIFSSDAWNSATFIAGEMRNPQRNIGLSLFLGTAMVCGLYVLTNLMYTAVLPVEEIAFAENDRVAVAVSQVIFGPVGTIIIALMIMVSTFGCNNGLILSGARVSFTMARDGLFFRRAGMLNKASVPASALWYQCALASIWCVTGTYGELLDMIGFVVVMFYVLTIIGIFVLRKTRPDHPRPYKAFGYPVLPIVYIVMGISFCLLLIIYRPGFTWPGLIITLAGIPVYYWSRRRTVNE